MSVTARGRRLSWIAGVAGVALGLVVAVVIGWLVRGMLVGETLVSGDGWRIEAKWSPFGSSVTYQGEGLSGGAGGLASPGILSEAISYVPPDGSAVFFVGVLPEQAATVRAAPDVESSTVLHEVVADVFYVVRVEGAPAEVRLEAVDEEGRVVDTAEQPVAGPSAGVVEPEVEALQGSAHCGWESVEILRVSTAVAPPHTDGDAWVSFVRDTEDVLPGRLVFGAYVADTTLPDDAVEIAKETLHGDIWLSAAEPDVAYVVTRGGSVEQWPAAYPGCD